MILKKLKPGTQLMWEVKYQGTEIKYPATVGHPHHYNKNMVMVIFPQTQHYMQDAEHLRHPTPEELKTLVWPSI